jgi:hypothetical protein
MSVKNKYAVMIINNTSKTIALKKGCVIGKLSPINEHNVVELKNSIINYFPFMEGSSICFKFIW